MKVIYYNQHNLTQINPHYSHNKENEPELLNWEHKPSVNVFKAKHKSQDVIRGKKRLPVTSALQLDPLFISNVSL